MFTEPSPAPIKHWLWRVGLIDSPELRLPMTPVSDVLAARIDREIERMTSPVAHRSLGCAAQPTEPGDAPCAIPSDLEAAILALNNANATELPWLDPQRLAALLGQAFYARRIGSVQAFLLAFDERADYDSPNYGHLRRQQDAVLWFRERYPRFVYVDRVAVAQAARGRGFARRLYADLMQQAAAAGHTVVVCEVNANPPNPASDALHAALGFAEVGAASIHGGSKEVRYFARAIASEKLRAG